MARKDITDMQVCFAYVESRKDKGGTHWPYEFLQLWTDQPKKVCYRAMERAFDRGYIEYGVSLRAGWLTEKGVALIANSEVGLSVQNQ